MADLKTYIYQFAHLRRAPNAIFTVATKKLAPHKPILLLAVLDLVARSVLTTPFIDVTGNLIELNDLFNLYWRRVMPIGQTSSIAFPFPRLNSEPFWELVPQPDCTITPALINNTASIVNLRRYALGARLEDDLFHVMQSAEGREALRETLLQSCFSDEAQNHLREQSLVNREAFDYSLLLKEQSHLPLVKETLEADNYRPAARDQGFRKIVVTTYDHRCTLCGIRIVTPDGHTVVEAAHIIPWCESKNDDIRNGMALCRLCHWGFDEGMLGVSKSYMVITSSSINLTPNFAGPLQALSGRRIISPSDEALLPALEYLSEHRNKWRL
ncbi:MAG: HNH endonuclease [Desulfuromonadales bacterium]